MNLLTLLEFEPAYIDVVVLHVCYYTTETPPPPNYRLEPVRNTHEESNCFIAEIQTC